MAGETGPISASLPIDMTIAGFFAVACFNSIEILISLLHRFKRYEGLYFWSMLTATLGIILHSIVVLLRYYALGPNFLLSVLTCVGWYGMVTGQSVVLYSRLHLIVSDKSKIRWVKYMILTNFCILHVPVTVLFLGSNTRDSRRFLPAFHVYEGIQLAGFFIQESVISGLYIWETARGLKPIFAVRKAMERNVMRHLIIVNVLVVILDVTLLVTQYSSNFQIQTTYKPVVYSIKLKMEFTVLNKLLLITQHNKCNCVHDITQPGTETVVPWPSYLNTRTCPSIEQNSSTRASNPDRIQLNHFPDNTTDPSSQTHSPGLFQTTSPKSSHGKSTHFEGEPLDHFHSTNSTRHLVSTTTPEQSSTQVATDVEATPAFPRAVRQSC